MAAYTQSRNSSSISRNSARNLDFIMEKAEASTKATLIWATITPVIQPRYNARFKQPYDPWREASDVDLYNEAAAPISQKHQVQVNDLNALVRQCGPGQMICDSTIKPREQTCCTMKSVSARAGEANHRDR